MSREPCSRCGTRADLGCVHQPASGAAAPLPTTEEPKVRKSTQAGQGFNFHRRKTS
jgi:hypothetical protein